MTEKSPAHPDMNELLAAEYTYIAQTAAQANEDRARVSSFYLIAVGSLVAALLGTQLFDPGFFNTAVNTIFSGLFFLLTLLGISTILQLARLRASWYESMLAMNQLKEFMVNQNGRLATAFRWTTKSLPPKYKTSSISYYQAVEVALIGALMFGAGVFFFERVMLPGAADRAIQHWIISGVAGVSMLFIQLQIYKRSL